MKRCKTILGMGLFGLLCAAVLCPVVLVPLLAVQDTDSLRQTLGPLVQFTGQYATIDLLPQYPTLRPFRELLLWTPAFYRVFWNSLGMVGCILLLQLVTAVPSAWAFARFRFRGRKLLFNLYVIFMLMPFQVTMLSQYIVLNRLHLMNTSWALILPAAFSTFAVFLMYRGFSDLPEDILDAARMDGASEWQLLWRIGLPLGKSGILACMVLSFLDGWNMVEQPLAFLKEERLYPLSLYLPTLHWSQAEQLLAASVIALIPAAFVFAIGQDYLEQGILATALKE